LSSPNEFGGRTEIGRIVSESEGGGMQKDEFVGRRKTLNTLIGLSGWW